MYIFLCHAILQRGKHTRDERARKDYVGQMEKRGKILQLCSDECKIDFPSCVLKRNEIVGWIFARRLSTDYDGSNFPFLPPLLNLARSNLLAAEPFQ